MSSYKVTDALLPHLHILCMDTHAEVAWRAAMKNHELSSSPYVQYTIHDTALSQLPADVRFDAVVSPANSYALLDGGFDDAISRAFSPRDDYGALTRHAQARVYAAHRGFLPPGQCQVVALPAEWRGRRRLRYHDGTGWGCGFLVLCPTMRRPGPCADPEIVYSCVWSLLNAVERHNRATARGGEAGKAKDGQLRIESILMTPLGTGVGKVSYEKWAAQAALAIKHWIDSVKNPDAWTKRTWADITKNDQELSWTELM